MHYIPGYGEVDGGLYGKKKAERTKARSSKARVGPRSRYFTTFVRPFIYNNGVQVSMHASSSHQGPYKVHTARSCSRNINSFSLCRSPYSHSASEKRRVIALRWYATYTSSYVSPYVARAVVLGVLRHVEAYYYSVCIADACKTAWQQMLTTFFSAFGFAAFAPSVTTERTCALNQPPQFRCCTDTERASRFHGSSESKWCHVETQHLCALMRHGLCAFCWSLDSSVTKSSALHVITRTYSCQ
jgi:hypothetical protein